MERRKGFALVVVLISLLILTALFTAASQRSLARLREDAGEALLLRRAAARAEVLELLLELPAEALPHGPLALPDGRIVRLQDCGGLIDLNTASPALLAQMAQRLDLPETALARLRDWRRSGLRLQRVADFARIGGLTEDEALAVARVATVYSGRPGIAPDAAPPEVLEIVTAPGGAVPEAFQSAPSGENFHVFLLGGERLAGVIGAVHLPPDRLNRRALALW